MTLLVRIAAAMYADNQRQVNALADARAQRHGYAFVPTQERYEDAPEQVRAMWEGYAAAAEKVFAVSQWKRASELDPGACFHMRERLDRSRHMLALLVHGDGKREDVICELTFGGSPGTRYFVLPDCTHVDAAGEE